MARYIIRRTLGAIAVLFVVSIVTFGLFAIVPAITGADPSYLYVGKTSTPAQREAVRHSFGLDKPVTVQYVEFVKGIVVGREFTDGTATGTRPCPAPCFGYSFRYSSPVWDIMMTALPITVSLCVGAAILWLAGGAEPSG
jgi:peptide/nickel transport system permease protein